jgi:hypothetical protein
MVLSEKEELLVKTLRSLSPDTADGKPVQWSGEWSEQDLEDARSHSQRAFDTPEQGLDLGSAT